jgi:N-acetylneuraminic acid mutarotase
MTGLPTPALPRLTVVLRICASTIAIALFLWLHSPDGRGGPTGASAAIQTLAAQCPAASLSAFSPSTVIFVPTGSLKTGRMDHTVTLLADGRALVVGGMTDASGAGTYLTSAELYDPTSGVWSTTSDLAPGRSGHTATRLLTGKVLVAGGSNYSNGVRTYLNDAWLFDPATGMWTATGGMVTERSGHTATLLPNGKVLVVGGENRTNDYANPIRTAEVYDPDSGVWSAAGLLKYGRLAHTATLLADGRVLVAGGINGLAPATSEVYNPTGGDWSTSGQLAVGRYDFTATLLDQIEVLAAGGARGRATVEVFSPVTGSWRITGSMITARCCQKATKLAGGKVLVTGGQMPYDGTIIRSTELFNPSTGTWAAAGEMTLARTRHAATLLSDGRVLIVGGYTAGGIPGLAQAELGIPLAAVEYLPVVFGQR